VRSAQTAAEMQNESKEKNWKANAARHDETPNKNKAADKGARAPHGV